MSNPFSKPIRLPIDGMVLTFSSLQDFEFCLDARTEVPARKVADLLLQPVTALRREGQSIRQVEERFMSVLRDNLDNPRGLSDAMSELDRKLFSQDYRWRSMAQALDHAPAERDDFRRAVLVRYVQYLRSRQSALREAYEEFRRREPAAQNAEPAIDPNQPASLRETVIFDVAELTPSEGGPALEPLPRGQPVKLRIVHNSVELHLSGHRFSLNTTTQPYALLDELGREYRFKPGRNTIGRDVHNEVVVDAAFRDVSRRHIMVEPVAPDFVQFTDHSSHGTYVAVGECVNASVK